MRSKAKPPCTCCGWSCAAPLSFDEVVFVCRCMMLHCSGCYLKPLHGVKSQAQTYRARGLSSRDTDRVPLRSSGPDIWRTAGRLKHSLCGANREADAKVFCRDLVRLMREGSQPTNHSRCGSNLIAEALHSFTFKFAYLQLLSLVLHSSPPFDSPSGLPTKNSGPPLPIV